MNDKQRYQYNIRYTLDAWSCQKCGRPATQMAHRIANTKTNRKIYGNKIDHNENLVSVCSLDCNSTYNIGNNPVKSAKLIAIINERVHYLKTAEINRRLLNV
jgi:hypothetical protein